MAEPSGFMASARRAHHSSEVAAQMAKGSPQDNVPRGNSLEIDILYQKFSDY